MARCLEPGVARVTASSGPRVSTASTSTIKATCGSVPAEGATRTFSSSRKRASSCCRSARAGQSGGSNDTENLGRPAALEVDPDANEVYIADGYGNRRIIVFDASTGAYKRHWGAYGDRPDDRELPAYDPEAEPIDQFRSPVHDVALSGDGLVYVADRTNNRLQVFQQDGTFVAESFIRPATLGSGAVSGIVLSPDPVQRWLFVPDGTNNVVWILDRSSLGVVSRFGRLGKYAGQFYRLHNLAVDSRGNLYTTEVWEGQRVQRFDRVSG